MHDVRVTEAGMKGGDALDARQRAVDRLDRIFARRLGAGLKVRLVDLYEIGPGGEEIAYLLVDGGGQVERQRPGVAVVECPPPAGSW